MNAPHNPAQARAWRKRAAAVFAAVGALIFSSGIVLLTAPAASADAPAKVGVCHRKASGSYVFLTVSANSAGEPHGHITHLEGNAGGVAGYPDYVKDSPSVPVGLTDAQFEDWCRGLNDGVDPVGSTVDLPALDISRIDGCDETGSVVEPTSQDVEYAITGGSWTGLTGDVTVTATLLDSADTFAEPAPGEWVVNGQTATWDISFGDATDCPDKITAVAPSATDNTCAQPGHLVLSNVEGDGYSWTGDTADVPGEHTVTAVADAGYELSGEVTWTLHVKAAGEGLTCGGGNGGGTTPDPDPVIPQPELIPVTPNYASATDATCSQRGALIVPNQPAGVLASRTGSVPGTVTFTYAPATGYTFPAGTVTEQSVTVEKKLSGEDCILGDEEVRPTHSSKPKHHAKPRDRGPVVLGTQAAVPTAVDAGLASLPTASVSSTGSPRLAQALVAGGLLMLVAGGSMGLGRRTRGAHES